MGSWWTITARVSRSPGDEPVGIRVAVTGTGPLKVVLVWTDPPSSSLATTNLVNDLDLVVSGPGGVFKGNSFSGGVSVPEGEPDRLNNVEVVYLPEPRRGCGPSRSCPTPSKFRSRTTRW